MKLSCVTFIFIFNATGKPIYITRTRKIYKLQAETFKHTSRPLKIHENFL